MGEQFAMAGFIVGGILTALAILVGLAVVQDQRLRKCAQAHNVFACEERVEYVPITDPASALPPG